MDEKSTRRGRFGVLAVSTARQVYPKFAERPHFAGPAFSSVRSRIGSPLPRIDADPSDVQGFPITHEPAPTNRTTGRQLALVLQ